MKEIGRNSNPNKNNKQDTLKKVQIRKKIEKTGLFARIIKIEDIIHNVVKIKKSNRLKDIEQYS